MERKLAVTQLRVTHRGFDSLIPYGFSLTGELNGYVTVCFFFAGEHGVT